LTCAAEWQATAVLLGAIRLRPSLHWSITLLTAPEGTVLLEETVTGTLETLPQAIARVAHRTALALGYPTYDRLVPGAAEPDTGRLDALLAYLEAEAARPHRGVETGGEQAMHQALLRALALDPTFQAPALALIGDLAASGEEERVAALVAAGLPQPETQGVVLAQLARLAVAEGRDRQASALVTALCALSIEDPETLALGARLALQIRHFAQARGLASMLIDKYPARLDGHELVAEALAAEGRFAGAAQEWEYLLARMPEHRHARLRLGAYLFAGGDVRRAYDVLRVADRLHELTVDTLVLLGAAMYRLGAYTQAAEVLQRAVARDPALVRAHTLLAACYRRLDEYRLALKHSAQAVMLAPDQWLPAIALGYDALHEDLPLEAAVIFAAVVRLRPDLAEALYGLGRALSAGGLHFDGSIALERARELDPRNYRILCALALAQYQSGDSRGAAHSLAAADVLMPGSHEVAHTRRLLKQVRRA
jgi:tetratricopeptide (TPR) repeat protein